MSKYLIIIICLFTFSASAQRPSSPRDTSQYKNLPAIGKVIGILKDSVSHEPMEFVSVALIQLRDSVAVGGSLTDGKGYFSVAEVKPGKYYLRVTSIGYRKMDSKPFLILPSDPIKDFGTVYVPPSSKNLKAVEIVGEKEEYVNSLDKKVYNVDKNLVSTGGSATDVLRNIPSVNVDVDGKVSLRGSENVTILIDGKPSGLGGGDKNALIDQLPAGTIDQIEVITNPSSRYDAEGMAGIINITTKKDRRNGMNGTATAGVGTNDKYNGGFILNSRKKKTNFFTQYSYKQETKTSTGETDRVNTFVEPNSNYSTSIAGHQYNESHLARAGFDYFANDYNTFSITGGFNHRYENKPEWDKYSFIYHDTIPDLYFNQKTSETEISKGFDGGLDFHHLVPGTKKEWNTSANISRNYRDGREEFVKFFALDTVSSDRISATKSIFSTGSFQSDFIDPLKNKTRFETGMKATFHQNDNDQLGTIATEGTNNFVTDPLYTDHFIYTDEIFAAYAQYSGNIKGIDYMGGLRAEESMIKGDSKDNAKDFTTNYLDFFPSATIKYNYKTFNDFQLSYSKRINRPGQQQLNPFTDYSDSLNVRTGNPQLKPEYISSYEATYMRKIRDQSISATLYYRQTENLMTRYRTLDSLGVTTVTFRNFSTSDNLGVEIVMRNQIGNKFNMLTSFNYFQNKINGSNIDAELQSTSTSWNLRSSINEKITQTTSIQLSGNYMSPVKQPQGSFKGMSGVDAGFRQEFMKGKLALNISVSDIFNSRKFQIHNVGSGFVLDSYRKRESRIAMFTLTYRFGSSDNTFKKRLQKLELPQQDMNQGDF